MSEIFLPVIVQGNPAILSLGCQIEHHQAPATSQWAVLSRQYQIPIKWRDVETIKGSYNWSAYDPDFQSLAGKRITAGVKIVPEWARLWQDYAASPPKSNCYADLANFIIKIIERYHVNAVELFNEPDVDRDTARWAEEFFGAWCISNDWYDGGLLYGQCLNAVYSTIKATYPNIYVVAGALVGSNSSLIFLQGAIDGGLNCDAVSFHKYINQGGNFNAAFEFGLQVAQKTPKLQILSETSVLSNTDSLALQQEQANYLHYLRSNYRNSCIDVIQWYSLANNGWMCADLVRNNLPTLGYNEFIREE